MCDGLESTRVNKCELRRNFIIRVKYQTPEIC